MGTIPVDNLDEYQERAAQSIFIRQSKVTNQPGAELSIEACRHAVEEQIWAKVTLTLI
jgi:hypothetical protein